MLRLADLIKELELTTFYYADELNRKIDGVYCGDLLSDVLANAEAGYLWITVQMHPNITGVASVKELSGILLSNDRKPQPETLEKAQHEKIPLLGSRLSTYDLATRIGRLLSADKDHAAAKS
ncbi:MAG TPA: serine kinase [bacterium]|jgi:serine kinase of HPr protein (carbohydrate metabolism regulator)